MNIQTDTGTINLSDIQADHLTVHTDTGSIHVGHFQGKDIHLETDTGPIEVEKGEGDIRFKRTQAASVPDCSTSVIRSIWRRIQGASK
jgi:DUF4097 and DUF4098 domain-containing protein YvlB